MADTSSTCYRFEVDLNLERFSGESVVQSIHVVTEEDGTISVASQGELWGSGSLGFQPGKLSLEVIRRLSRFRHGLRHLSEITGQDVTILHEGRRIASLHQRAGRAPRLSLNWWAIFRQSVLTWRRG